MDWAAQIERSETQHCMNLRQERHWALLDSTEVNQYSSVLNVG